MSQTGAQSKVWDWTKRAKKLTKNKQTHKFWFCCSQEALLDVNTKELSEDLQSRSVCSHEAGKAYKKVSLKALMFMCPL